MALKKEAYNQSSSFQLSQHLHSHVIPVWILANWLAYIVTAEPPSQRIIIYNLPCWFPPAQSMGRAEGRLQITPVSHSSPLGSSHPNPATLAPCYYELLAHPPPVRQQPSPASLCFTCLSAFLQTTWDLFNNPRSSFNYRNGECWDCHCQALQLHEVVLYIHVA